MSTWSRGVYATRDEQWVNIVAGNYSAFCEQEPRLKLRIKYKCFHYQRFVFTESIFILESK